MSGYLHWRRLGNCFRFGRRPNRIDADSILSSDDGISTWLAPPQRRNDPINRSSVAGPPPQGRRQRRSAGDPQAIGDRPFGRLGIAARGPCDEGDPGAARLTLWPSKTCDRRGALAGVAASIFVEPRHRLRHHAPVGIAIAERSMRPATRRSPATSLHQC
jgi:hypothetical protein